MNNINKSFNGINKSKIDKNAIAAAKKGDTDALLKTLSKEDKEKLNSILNDKKALENILKSPQAAEIMKAFGSKTDKK